MKRCLQCSKEIKSKYNKFCNSSCAATFNNIARSKDKVKPICKCCGRDILRYGKRDYKFCNFVCTAKYRREQTKIKNRKLFAEGKLRYRRGIYHILCEQRGNKCAICGLTEWNNQPIRLWVDHIDGNAGNNMPNNFRLLCPNCESQTNTSRGKNRGKGRGSRGIKIG